MYKRIFIFLFLVLVGAAGAAYLFLNGDRAVKETPLQIIVGNFFNATIFELSNNRLQDVSFTSTSGDNITSRFRRPNIGAAMTVFQESGALGNALILETAEGNQFLETPFGIKDVPALSFDGSLVAYSELALPVGTLSSEEVADWRIRVLDAESGEITDLGIGYAPYFISQDPDIVLFSSPEGIVSINLETEERSVFADRTVSQIAHAAHVSPDGTHFAAYNDVTGYYSIFRIVDADSLEVSAVGEIFQNFELSALSDQYFYGAHRDQETDIFTIWQYALKDIAPLVTEGMRIYTFEEGVVPYQLIP